MKIGFLLRTAEALATLGLGLLLLALFVLLGTLSGTISLMGGDALGLALLVGGGLGLGLGLGLDGLALLFTLYLGVLGGIPGFEDLWRPASVVGGRLAARRPGSRRVLTSLSSSSSPNWRRRAAAATGGDEGGVLEPPSSSSARNSGQRHGAGRRKRACAKPSGASRRQGSLGRQPRGPGARRPVARRVSR